MSLEYGRHLAEVIIQNQQLIPAPSAQPSLQSMAKKDSRPPIIKPFPTPYQSVTVPAKTSKQVVYEWKLPAKSVAFIQYVGNNMFENFYLYWFIDRDLIISPYINWQIAPVNVPKVISPWIRVNEEIVWVAKNLSALGCLVEVLCDGFYTSTNDLDILYRMNLPISIR